jgi:hypothetical protein
MVWENLIGLWNLVFVGSGECNSCLDVMNCMMEKQKFNGIVQRLEDLAKEGDSPVDLFWWFDPIGSNLNVLFEF